MEPPLTGSFCDLLWADPLLEDVLGYKLSDRDYADVREFTILLISSLRTCSKEEKIVYHKFSLLKDFMV
jgi:hypothetical protein